MSQRFGARARQAPPPPTLVLARLVVAVAITVALTSLLAPIAGARSAPRAHRSPTTLGMLALGSGYTDPRAAARVRRLQRELARDGEAPGPIDGRYGPSTEGAVQRFQFGHGLVVDGITGPRTWAALAAPSLAPGAGFASGGAPVVRALQRRLADAHVYAGAIDGLYGPLTEHAVKLVQARHGLHQSGIANMRTMFVLTAVGPAGPPSHTKARASAQPQSAKRLAPAGKRRSRPASKPSGNKPPAATRPASATQPATGQAKAASHPGGGFPPARLLIAAAFVLICWAMLVILWRRRIAARASRPQGQPPAPFKHRTITATRPAHRLNGDSSAAAYRAADEHGSATGSFDLGVLLQSRGDFEHAADAYRRADALGDPRAPSNLGVLLEGEGDSAGAEAAYRRADGRNDALGAFNLGVLLEEQHQLEAAIAAYRRAWQRGHGEAAANLGVLLESAGDAEGAEVAYRGADALGDAHGAFNLGVLLETRGDFEGAQGAYARAEARGAPAVSRTARAAQASIRSRQKAG